MSPAWPLSVPANSLHFATVLIVLAISVDPQPPCLGRILFSECATFCYFVLAISPSLTGTSAHRHLSSGFEKNGKFLSGAMVNAIWESLCIRIKKGCLPELSQESSCGCNVK